MGLADRWSDYYKSMFGKERNNKVKAGMAIAEAHASVTSPIGHAGFNFVQIKFQTNAYIKVETLQFILFFFRMFSA